VTSTVIGFRKTLESTVPEQVRDIRSKVLRLTEELEICREDEAYLVAIAKVAGIDLENIHENAGSATCGEEWHGD
jgi:DNA-directed RNA polymerase specialized sigma subunit